MNKEIKEISIKIPGQILDYLDTKEHLLELFNYITNLEQENERLSVELNKNMIERNNYLSRNEKAIEYIMTELITEWDIKNDGYVSGSDLPVDVITPLLNILQGEDKDE